MSAPPFFQSAGRGDLKFWGEDDGPTEKLILLPADRKKDFPKVRLT